MKKGIPAKENGKENGTPFMLLGFHRLERLQYLYEKPCRRTAVVLRLC